jgi:hypothetical protein
MQNDLAANGEAVLHFSGEVAKDAGHGSNKATPAKSSKLFTSTV